MTIRTLVLATAALLASATLAPRLLAADVTGRVVGPTGAPAAGARVYVEGWLRGAVTDRDGRFRITDIAPGEWSLVVEALGAARERTSVRLAEGTPAEVRVALKPNMALAAAARRFVEPQPERMAQKQAYLSALQPTGRRLPNIVLILFDDLGWGDLGVYGNRLIKTPNIDRLARDGVRLDQFYSASPVCSPSRASLMTARYPQRSRSANHVFFPEGSSAHVLRRAAGFTNAIMPDEIMLPEVLGRVGYRTAMVGKWHLGDRAGRLPNDLGFQSFYGVRFSNDMQPLNIYRDAAVEIPAAKVEQSELTGLFTDAAVTEIERKDARPLFLYLPYTAPHVPHAAHGDHAGRSDAGTYGDIVEEVDAAVGRVRAALRAAGRERDTLILITSDNGADRRGNQGPFLGHKQETFEGGQRVPLIAHWPGKLPRGQVRQGMGMVFDLAPTLYALAGVPLPQDRIIDGRDLWPVLSRGAASPHERLFYVNAWSGVAEAVRDQRYKYRAPVFNQLLQPFYPGDFGLPVTDAAMLTDLALDRETHDLSAKHPEMQRALAAALDAFRAEDVRNPRGWR